MRSDWKTKGEKIHSRTIEINTYKHDGRRILVEGFLKDERIQESYALSGDTFPAGIIHHMAIRLLVNCSDLLIEDIDVDLLTVPREPCRETINSLAAIKGLTITKGFTSKVKKFAGRNKGCIHLVELILAMAPAVFQGAAAHQFQKTSGFDSDQAVKVFQSVVNTCHAWREDGPLVEMFKKKLIDR